MPLAGCQFSILSGLRVNQPINPYQSPRTASVAVDTQGLAFAGEIDAIDYAALLPRGNFESILYKVLLTLLASMSVVFGGAIIFGTITRRATPDFAIFVIVTLMVIGVWVVWRRIKSQHRAERALKRHPDLIGLVHGHLTESGLAFHDGKRQHWFGPQRLLEVTFSDDGVRIPVDQNPERYIALTSRLFDDYSLPAIQQLFNHWRQSASAVTTPDETLGLDLWIDLAPMPDDSVAFQGSLTIKQPMRTPLNRQAAIAASASPVVLITMGYFGTEVFATWAQTSFIVLGILLILWSLFGWWQYFRGTTVVTWNQLGWISPDELAVVRGCHGVRMSKDEFSEHVDHGEIVELIAHSAAIMFLARDQVSDDEQWAKIKDFLTRPEPVAPSS